MNQIHISEKVTFSLPSRMEELTPSQLKKMMWVLSIKKLPIDKAKLIVLVQSLSLPFWKRIRFQFFYFFTASTIERADILYQTLTFQDFRRFTSQKFKKIRSLFVLLHGPDSGLANATLWEYIKAEKYYLRYSSTNKSEWLDLLVATLYRPQRKKYSKFEHEDIRVPLNDAVIKKFLPYVEKIDLETKLSILAWFDNCREQIIKHFPLIFPKAPAQEKTNPLQQIKKKSTEPDWMPMISELAGSMDNYDKIGNTNLFTAFTDISHRIKKNQQAKIEAAQNKRRKK
ncbi:hypothetical protein [Mongoliibacter ruber]|uniref:Uncharacterized protein n=1 Tax=Mongoliibacter ruber TaxID=1750599 RepID=A0A2T0WV45_9BACT|nr:hypothetical protein [Mongoliibacter ruber]PRY90566.1 hypothetical protein CLW00_101229 [Mongoliibacter ruber]